MNSSGTTHTMSPRAQRVGQVLGVGACLMMFFSAGIKVVLPPGTPEHFAELGWPIHYVHWLAPIEAACTALYLFPRTRVLGAILLTAYLGGAVAAHVRIGEPLVLFQVGLGVALWAGLYLRDARVQALVPSF